MLRLRSDHAELARWNYTPNREECNSRIRAAYLRDVEFGPASQSFYFVSTGGRNAEGHPRTICDAAARFDIRPARPDRPVWVNRARVPGQNTGDSLWALSAADSGILYVQGHQRYMRARSGLVPREGIAAINTATGYVTSWNPGKQRGVGGMDLDYTSDGLWVPSDTQFIGTPHERHERLAHFPQ